MCLKRRAEILVSQMGVLSRERGGDPIWSGLSILCQYSINISIGTDVNPNSGYRYLCSCWMETSFWPETSGLAPTLYQNLNHVAWLHITGTRGVLRVNIPGNTCLAQGKRLPKSWWRAHLSFPQNTQRDDQNRPLQWILQVFFSSLSLVWLKQWSLHHFPHDKIAKSSKFFSAEKYFLSFSLKKFSLLN